MSHLRFDGQGAGLGKRQGGNANSQTDYTLICTCKSELGVLAAFTQVNASGDVSVFCPVCEHITFVHKASGTVKGYVKAPAEVVAKAAAQKRITL